MLRLCEEFLAASDKALTRRKLDKFNALCVGISKVTCLVFAWIHLDKLTPWEYEEQVSVLCYPQNFARLLSFKFAVRK